MAAILQRVVATAAPTLNRWSGILVAYAPHMLAAHVALHCISAAVVALRTKRWDSQPSLGRGFAARAGLFFNSFVHSVIVAAASIVLIHRCGVVSVGTMGAPLAEAVKLDAATELEAGGNACGGGVAPRSLTRPLIALSVAYFAFDLVATAPTWRRYPADLAHHLCGLLLTGACLLHPGPAALAQHILLTEASTPFYVANYLLLKLGNPDGLPFKASSLAFAAAFFVTRTLYLTYITGIVWLTPEGRAGFLRPVPLVALALAALTILNGWWFTKILRLLGPVLGLSASKVTPAQAVSDVAKLTPTASDSAGAAPLSGYSQGYSQGQGTPMHAGAGRGSGKRGLLASRSSSTSGADQAHAAMARQPVPVPIVLAPFASESGAIHNAATAIPAAASAGAKSSGSRRNGGSPDDSGSASSASSSSVYGSSDSPVSGEADEAEAEAEGKPAAAAARQGTGEADAAADAASLPSSPALQPYPAVRQLSSADEADDEQSDAAVAAAAQRAQLAHGHGHGHGHSLRRRAARAAAAAAQGSAPAPAGPVAASDSSSTEGVDAVATEQGPGPSVGGVPSGSGAGIGASSIAARSIA